MNIIELAIENGFSPPECPDEWADKIYQSTLKRLEAFAQAAIEEYKASLVPVMWWDGDGDYADDVMLPSIRQSHIDTNSTMYLDYPIPLYDLGETK